MLGLKKMMKKKVTALTLAAILIGTTVLTPALSFADEAEQEASGSPAPASDFVPGEETAAAPAEEAAIPAEEPQTVAEPVAAEKSASAPKEAPAEKAEKAGIAAADDSVISDSAGLIAALSDQNISRIQLKAGSYKLNKVMKITRSIAFESDGKAVIESADSQRHFEVDGPQIALSFQNVVIDGANASGGILAGYYSGGSVSLTGAVMKNCVASNPTHYSDFNIYPNSGGAVDTFCNLKLQNCRFENNKAWYLGGAVSANKELEVSNCLFTGNETLGPTSVGGAVYFGGTKATISACTFDDNHVNLNSTSGRGGALYAPEGAPGYPCADVTVSKSTFTNNSAVSEGGAICARKDTTLAVIDSDFIGNKVVGNGTHDPDNGGGGGIYAFGAFHMQGGTMKNNTADETSPRGGAINLYGYFTSAHIAIEDVTFENNSAPEGGGIYGFHSDLTIHNVRFNDNEALDYGGALFNSGDRAKTEIESSAFTKNTASYGGGLMSYSPLEIRSSSFSDNKAIYGGGALYSSSLSNLKTTDVTFANNTSPDTCDWDIETALADQDAAAKVHARQIQNTTFTAPFGNAYNNADVCYSRNIGQVNFFSNITGEAIGNLSAEASKTLSVVQYGRYDLLAAEQVGALGWDSGEMVFKGWAEQRDGEIVSGGPFYMTTDEVNFYAIWEVKKTTPATTGPAVVLPPLTNEPEVEQPEVKPEVEIPVVDKPTTEVTIIQPPASETSDTPKPVVNPPVSKTTPEVKLPAPIAKPEVRMPVSQTATHHVVSQRIQEVSSAFVPATAAAPIAPVIEKAINETIEPNDTPLAAEESTGAWSLMNLLLTLLQIGLMMGLIVTWFAKHEQDDRLDAYGNRIVRKHGMTRLIGILAAITAIVLFLATQDMSQHMVPVDRYTIAHILIAALEIGMAALSVKTLARDEAGTEVEVNA